MTGGLIYPRPPGGAFAPFRASAPPKTRPDLPLALQSMRLGVVLEREFHRLTVLNGDPSPPGGRITKTRKVPMDLGEK